MFSAAFEAAESLVFLGEKKSAFTW